jgi:putative chitinase
MNLDNLSVPDKVKQELWFVMSKFQINTIDRLSHFLAQCAQESGSFRSVSENLNYSVSSLKKVFPKYFKDKDPKAYSKAPQALANYVYSNRLGNGSEASGDGWRFRGRGYIQLTGKDNYKAFDAFVDDDILANPDLVATKYPLLSAAWFWSVNKINNLADAGIDVDDITRVTKKVNGGHKGLHERIMFTHRYYAELSVKGT